MTEDRKYRRKKSHGGMVAMMLAFIALILFSTVFLFLPEEKPKKKTSTSTVTVTPTEAVVPVPEETETLAVVLEVDTEVKMITVYNVEDEEIERLVYAGATAFYDGYGVQLAASQLKPGDLYRFQINTKEDCISNAYEGVDRREKPQNTEVWEKTGVDYMTITDGKISFRGQNYRYYDGVCVMNNGKRITLEDIAPTVDIVTVRGVGQVIYEIVVTKGHGYITLANYEDFIGGVITIGSTRIDSVYEDAVYTVREGTYKVVAEHGKYVGKEDITVERDATTVFDLYEYGSGPIPKGWLTINIDPLGADLYINGVKMPYTDGVELEYGTYRFEFAEGGYISYNATVLIDQPKQSLSVFLIEQTVEETKPENNDSTTDSNTSQGNSGTAGGNSSENSGSNNGSSEGSGSSTGSSTGNTSGDNTVLGTMTSISLIGKGYTLDMDNAVYILGPNGAEIYLDGEYLGRAPMDFEKIIGSYVITVIRSDGAVKNFNCSETDNGSDSYYNFSWID